MPICAFDVVFNAKDRTDCCMLWVGLFACGFVAYVEMFLDYTVYIVKCLLSPSLLWHHRELPAVVILQHLRVPFT